MGFWLTELQQLEAFLTEIEADQAAMANLRTVEQTLDPSTTADWAINEAVTTQLHRVFLFSDARDVERMSDPDALKRHVANAREALTRMPAGAATHFAAIVDKLDGGEKPISTQPFWSTYFSLLAEPSPFRVPPRPHDPNAMPHNWDTVGKLLDSTQLTAARDLVYEFEQSDNLLRRRRPKGAGQRAVRRKYHDESTHVLGQAAIIRGYMDHLNIKVVEDLLRKLNGRISDHTDVNEARGRFPELRRQRARMDSSPSTHLLVSQDSLSPIHQVWMALFVMMLWVGTAFLSWRHLMFFAEEPYEVIFISATAAFAIWIAWIKAADSAGRNYRLYSILFAIPLAVAGTLAMGSPLFGIAATTAVALLNGIYHRQMARFAAWRRWNQFVHTSMLLTAKGNGGGIHKVLTIEDSLPWVVSLEPLPNTPEPFRTVRVRAQPEFAPGDYVVLTAGGEVEAWVTAACAESGLKEGQKSTRFTTPPSPPRSSHRP